MQTAQAQRQEQRWNELLAHLKPWELHALLADSNPYYDNMSMELFLHDGFVAGNLYLRDVYACIEGRLALHNSTPASCEY